MYSLLQYVLLAAAYLQAVQCSLVRGKDDVYKLLPRSGAPNIFSNGISVPGGVGFSSVPVVGGGAISSVPAAGGGISSQPVTHSAYAQSSAGPVTHSAYAPSSGNAVQTHSAYAPSSAGGGSQPGTSQSASPQHRGSSGGSGSGSGSRVTGGGTQPGLAAASGVPIFAVAAAVGGGVLAVAGLL